MVGIVVAFIAGTTLGIAATAIIAGIVDDITEWRKKRNEQKRKDHP